jgi:polysaccharide export outer membrane protein
VLISSTRKLQTEARLLSVRRQRGELDRDLERLDDRRRINVLAELQTASLALAEKKSRLYGLQRKRSILGLPDSIAPAGDDPTFTVVRSTIDGPRTISAHLDTELLPGDVIQIGRSIGLMSLTTDMEGEKESLIRPPNVN